jgi:hypothetical protein
MERFLLKVDHRQLKMKTENEWLNARSTQSEDGASDGECVAGKGPFIRGKAITYNRPALHFMKGQGETHFGQ